MAQFQNPANSATLSTVNNSLIMGPTAGTSLGGSDTDNILIGNTGTGGDTHTIRIGTSGVGSGQQNKTFLAAVTGTTPAGSTAGVVLVDSNGQLGALGVASNGQLVIGSTGAQPVLAALTAGNGITITNGAGSISIAASNFPTYTHVTGTTVSLVAGNGYILDNAGLVTATLPATAAFGTTIEIVGMGAGGWKIAQNSGQQIDFLGAATTLGATGTISSTTRYDSCSLVCIVADTTWTVIKPSGNLLVA